MILRLIVGVFRPRAKTPTENHNYLAAAGKVQVGVALKEVIFTRSRSGAILKDEAS
jgi:hypothetical protein